jgi:hypothetical protein
VEEQGFVKQEAKMLQDARGFETHGGHNDEVEPRSNGLGAQFGGLQSLASSNGFIRKDAETEAIQFRLC